MTLLKDIVYLTSKHHAVSSINDLFEKHKVYFIEDFFSDKKKLSLFHEKDSAYNLFCNELNKHQDSINAVVINYELDGKNCFSIAHHIRLHNYNNPLLNSIPIIITHKELLIYSKPKYRKINDLGFFKYNTGAFILIDDLSDCKFDPLTERKKIQQIIYDFKNDFDYSQYLDQLEIHPPKTTSRHQISNEWGAYKLAKEAGFDISYKLPQTLYFKFLKAKFKLSEKDISIKQRLFSKELEVILIDDNYDKGWKEALELVLPAKIDSYSTIEEFSKQNVSIYKNYDLLFLDLYMPNQKQNIETTSSYTLLKKLKRFNPAIPIIIFTASNKVWNMQLGIEHGADGYFVKESPENAKMKEFSVNNYNSFKKLILNNIDKSRILKPYWKQISFIKENFLPVIKDVINFKNPVFSTKFKSRIEERLVMFFGLLKRGYEQTKFNKELFHFSDYELAFITLWSILNEISEASYQKIHHKEILELTDKNGKKYTKHPDNRNIIPFNSYNWKIKNQDDFLIKSEFKFKSYEDDGSPIIIDNVRYDITIDSHTTYIGRTMDPPYYKEKEGNREAVKREISNQIAFLIVKKESFKNYDNKHDLLIKLHELNEIRNHLYLTHGNYITKGFYQFTEKEKRGDPEQNVTPKHKIDPQNDIKDLFELVGFLLTGKEVIIQF